ncbi:MAG: RES family NAD+ phosphorylase [Lachnospiraceae bacterium]|nr:RES family NAD+ phosphorylase [Lachnospiraceae bacterium]
MGNKKEENKNIENKSTNSKLSEAANYLAGRKSVFEVNEKLLHNNRFFTDDSFLLILKEILDKCEKTIEPDTILFRSRIYNEADKEERKNGITVGQQFEGYDAKESFVNEHKDWPSYGRMNPNGIRVLYTSSDLKTSMKELNPAYGELLSVAKIQCKKSLKIADMSLVITDDNDMLKKGIIETIQEQLSQGYSEKEYIFSQYVAAYCQKLGFDGIGFRSKYSTKSDHDKNNGINYTIFNYKKCEVISSELHIIKNVTLQEDSISINKKQK